MANFFTRLAERSLGLSPVVQPAIAPRFSSAPAMTDEVDSHWSRKAEHPSYPGASKSSVRVASPSPIFPVQEQHSPPEPDLFINLVQGSQPHSKLVPSQLSQSVLSKPSSGQPSVSAVQLSRPSQLIHPISDPSVRVASPSPIFPVQEQHSPPEPDLFINPVQGSQPHSKLAPSQLSQSVLPKPSSEQPIVSAAHAIAPVQSSVEESSQVASLKPFQVLRSREQISIASHPSLAIAPLNRAAPNASELVSDRLPVQPNLPQNRSDRRIESQQIPFAQSPDQINLRSAEPSPFPPVSAEPTAAPPTIRVSIGRVEVRAVMPTPPAPKIAPARSHPAVSLNDYLKQRGNKP